jgi:RAD51-like protein 2
MRLDTEGGITPHTLQAAVQAASGSSVLSETLSAANIAKFQGTAVSNMLRGIHLVRVPTQVQMIAFLHTLDEWIEEHPNVSSPFVS